MLEALIIALGLVQAACGLQVNLHHRLLIPGTTSPFVLKGSVDLDHVPGSQIHATYIPSESVATDLVTFAKHMEGSSSLYQVALEVPDVPQDQWPFSSVQACHLPSAKGERITLHAFPSGMSPRPHSIDYWLINAPDNGACPPASSSTNNIEKALHTFDAANWNTTIVTKVPTTPPVVSLRVPPPINPDGKPAEIKPEPSFISKYWMYLMGGFIVLTFIIPAPEEEAPKGNKAS